MNFGEAIDALKSGQRVARAGWNGKGMWLAFMPGMTIPAGQVNTRTRKFLPDGDLTIGGYIVMWTAQGIWQPGWLASQMDILAEDWEIVPPS